MAPNWLHVYHQLTWGWAHIHAAPQLYAYWRAHHGIGFLRSGYTSETWRPGLLHWLARHGIAPVDW